MLPARLLFRTPLDVAILFLLLCILTAQACSPLSLPRARVSAPISEDAFPDAGAVVTDAKATLEYRVTQLRGDPNKRLIAVLDERRRLKILRRTGLSEAQIVLPVDGMTTVTRVVARAIAPTGEVTWMPTGVPRFVPGVDGAPEVGMLHFTVPGVEQGGDVEYRYERVFLDPTLVPPFVFGGPQPTLHAELGIVVDPAIKLDLRFGRGDTGYERAALRRKTPDGRDRLIFVENDLPAYFPEPLMAHPAHAAPWVAFALRRTQLGPTPIRIESWDDVGRGLIDKLRGCRPTAGRGATLSRLKAMRESLVAVRMQGLGIRTPQAAKALLNGAPACSRDAASVTLGALQGAPTHARLALLTGPRAAPLAPDFPTPAAFSRAVVALPIETAWLAATTCSGPIYARDALCGRVAGEMLYFDPLCRDCPLGVLPPGEDGSRVLWVEGDGRAQWTDLPPEPPGRHSLTLEAHLSLDVDGSLAGTLAASGRGTVACALRHDLRTAAAEGERLTLLEAAILGPRHKARLRKPVIRAQEETEHPIAVDGVVTGQLKREKAEHFSLSVEDLLGSSIPDAWRPSRRQAAIVGGPRWAESTLEMLLPVDYTAELLPPTRLVTSFGEYGASWVQDGRSLRYTRRFVLKVGTVASADWPSFQDFFAAVQSAEAAPIPVGLKL